MEVEDPYGFIDDRCHNLPSGSDSEGSEFPYFEPEADEEETERLFLMTMQSTQSTPKETFHTPPERAVDLDSDSCSERKRTGDFERRPLSLSKKPRLSRQARFPAEEQKKTILEITMRLECPGFYADTARLKVRENLNKSVNSLKNYGSTFLREVGINERRSKCKMNFSLVLHRSSPQIIHLQHDADLQTVNNLAHDTDAMEFELAGSAHEPRMDARRDVVYSEGKDLSLHGKGNAVARGESVLKGGNTLNAQPCDHPQWGRYSEKSNGVQNSQMGIINSDRRRYSTNDVIAGDYAAGGVENVDNSNVCYTSIYGSPQLEDVDNPNICYKSIHGSPPLEVRDHQGVPRSAATINLENSKYSSGNKEAVSGFARTHNDRENLGDALRGDHRQDDIRRTTSEHGEIRSGDGEDLNAQAFQGLLVERCSESVYDVERMQNRVITGNNVASPPGAIVDKGSGELPPCVDNWEPEPPCIEIPEAASPQSKFDVCDVLKRLAANPKDPVIVKESIFDMPPCVDNRALAPLCIEIPEAASSPSKFDVCDVLKTPAANSKDPVILKESNFDVADALIVLAMGIKNHGVMNEHILDMSGLTKKMATNSKEKESVLDFAKKRGMTFPSLRRC